MSRLIIKKLHRPSGKLVKLGELEYLRGKLSDKWEPAGEPYRDMFVLFGIDTAAGNFKLSDGKTFFDNLPLAFSHSSAVFIETA